MIQLSEVFVDRYVDSTPHTLAEEYCRSSVHSVHLLLWHHGIVEVDKAVVIEHA